MKGAEHAVGGRGCSGVREGDPCKVIRDGCRPSETSMLVMDEVLAGPFLTSVAH